MVVLFVLAFCIVALTDAQQGPCFEFSGGQYLEFEPNNIDLSNSIHYRLSFQTSEPNGIILYAKGSHDYEVLYVREGLLYYTVVNPEDTGVGRTSGVTLKSDMNVDINKRITVEVFRNRRVHRDESQLPGESPPLRTGMTFKVDGEKVEEEHYFRELIGVNIQAPIYIGGSGRELSATVREFKGQISNIQELKSDKTLVDPIRNFGEVQRCFGRPPQ